ncbi:MAG TPA: hypothetical protein VGI46_20120 [Candidatus Acidoferrum sp.]|jgi:hypothetical protein
MKSLSMQHSLHNLEVQSLRDRVVAQRAFGGGLKGELWEAKQNIHVDRSNSRRELRNV